MDAAEIERLLDAPPKRRSATANLTGPVTVLGSEEDDAGRTRVDVQASRLVAVDPDDAELADVCIPVPVSATVVLDASGHLARVESPATDHEADRQARAYARNLVANGSISGLQGPVGAVRRGPPSRPTHEVAVDARGRKVIRRIGFVAAPLALDPKAQHGPTSHHETGGTNDG